MPHADFAEQGALRRDDGAFDEVVKVSIDPGNGGATVDVTEVDAAVYDASRLVKEV